MSWQNLSVSPKLKLASYFALGRENTYETMKKQPSLHFFSAKFADGFLQYSTMPSPVARPRSSVITIAFSNSPNTCNTNYTIKKQFYFGWLWSSQSQMLIGNWYPLSNTTCLFPNGNNPTTQIQNCFFWFACTWMKETECCTWLVTFLRSNNLTMNLL